MTTGVPIGPGTPHLGVSILGTGSATPRSVLTNEMLTRMMDTSDEWIVQRTGIRERRVINRKEFGECTLTLSTQALKGALAAARLDASELDLVILATMTPEMACPATSSRLVTEIGAGNAAAWDTSAACCSFVFALNSAYAMIRSGMYRCVGLVGADTLSVYMKYETAGRDTAILFGDGAGAVVFRATDDTKKGLIAQSMHTDGTRWAELYIPECEQDIPQDACENPHALGELRMNGRAVFRFAVTTFGDLIQQTLDQAGLKASDVDHYVCHQSNARILAAARERFGIPDDRMIVNIDRYGNTVSASVPLCFDELAKSGRLHEGQRVMFLGFGGGLTWGSSLWQL